MVLLLSNTPIVAPSMAHQFTTSPAPCTTRSTALTTHFFSSESSFSPFFDTYYLVHSNLVFNSYFGVNLLAIFSLELTWVSKECFQSNLLTFCLFSFLDKRREHDKTIREDFTSCYSLSIPMKEKQSTEQSLRLIFKTF